MTRFTSGPWKVDYQDKRGGNIIAPSGPVASTRWFGVTHKQVMEDYANADLIATAPELYEALAELLSYATKMGGLLWHVRDQNCAKNAYAALAKARGEP